MKLTQQIVQKAMDKMPFKSPYTASEWLENLYLENYHCHKDFSNVVVTDCAESIENYAKRIKELGSGQCLYSGEHGSQGNQFHVYKVAEQFGLKYRHSAEVYWVKDRHQKDRANCHMMIIAKNPEGRKDLNYILSIANEDGYYYQPRIDLELLFSVNPENFIVTSACLGNGWGKYSDFDEVWLSIANHFKGNFFFEVQNHNTQRQKELNRHLLELSKKHNIPIICGLDSHYVLEENRIKRELMQKDKGIEFNEEEANWYLDYPDTTTVIERFEKQGVLNQEQILEAILNTNVFVNECEEITLNREFKIPNIYKDLDYEGRVNLFKKKINEKYKQDPYKSKEKIQGIRWEVDQFVESKTVDYPLFSEAMVRVAEDQYGAVLTRTARGSGSSFITNNYMGLTTIDRFTSDVPLFAERFLTKERVLAHQIPDIDLNISQQEPFVKAIRQLLGEHGCYPLMTRSTYKEKSAWLMYARVNGIEAEKSFAVSKALDQYNKDLRYADDEDKDGIHVEDYIPVEYAELYEESKSYQGTTVAVGIHACGHLCFDGDIRREIGLISAKSETTGKRTLVACVEGQHLDEFGYVKEDLLIVDAVSLTKEMFDSIGEPVPPFEELKKMIDGDQATWDIYKNGITCCVNQMEKEATTKKGMKYAPQNIAELTAFIASIRPSFASLLNNFINRKPYSIGEEKIDEILESSSHYMLYQESIMAVLSFLGLPMGETYSVIKSISKKKLKGEKKANLLKELQEAWIKEFGNLDNFDKVWKVIEDAASYAFNACVSGDTLIKRPGQSNKWHPTIEEMFKIKNDAKYAKETNHKHLHDKYINQGYGTALSLDIETGRITKNQIVDIRESGVKEIYRVQTENGSYIDCTMNHKFPMRDGSKKMLCELQVGDELIVQGEYEKHPDNYRFTNGRFHNNYPKKGQCGFQKKENGNYVRFFKKRERMIEQEKPCELCHKEYKPEEKFELHHKDMDRANNRPSNLQWLCNSCHKKAHYNQGRIKVYGKGIPIEYSKIVSIEYLREDVVYDIEMAAPNHTFVTENGIVTSNSHAYAMAGDSLYLAWFKAHHPAKFYEVAINHYQKKGNKNKIDALIKEAMKFYGYKIGDYAFGADNRQVNIQEEEKVIYPNLSAVKGFGEKVVEQLYEAGQGEFPDFASVYSSISETALNKTQMGNLAKLGYFSKYGNENQILALIKLYDFISETKSSISKKKLEENSIPLEMVIPFGRETKTRIMDLDKEALLKVLESQVNENEPTDYQKLYWQWKITGIADKQFDSIPMNEMLVTNVQANKGSTRVRLYSPKRGKSIEVKIQAKKFEAVPLEEGNFIRLEEIKRQIKKEFTGKILDNGKREYLPVPSGETEPWASKYTILDKAQ